MPKSGFSFRSVRLFCFVLFSGFCLFYKLSLKARSYKYLLQHSRKSKKLDIWVQRSLSKYREHTFFSLFQKKLYPYFFHERKSGRLAPTTGSSHHALPPLLASTNHRHVYRPNTNREDPGHKPRAFPMWVPLWYHYATT